MKMLLRIAAQTFSPNYTLYASSVCGGISKTQCRFLNFDFLYRKFNLSPDWFLIFDCRLLTFQRHTLYTCTRAQLALNADYTYYARHSLVKITEYLVNHCLL